MLRQRLMLLLYHHSQFQTHIPFLRTIPSSLLRTSHNLVRHESRQPLLDDVQRSMIAVQNPEKVVLVGNLYSLRLCCLAKFQLLRKPRALLVMVLQIRDVEPAQKALQCTARIQCSRQNKETVNLCFHPSHTPRLLRVLSINDQAATLFVVQQIPIMRYIQTLRGDRQ